MWWVNLSADLLVQSLVDNLGLTLWEKWTGNLLAISSEKLVLIIIKETFLLESKFIENCIHVVFEIFRLK